ncbi:hypothetical protein DL771_009642 [Monosporascus sp. 5C6A]|nr:hypothetical protein DL771_009642 [Monosporascus sp. 5C6A]
MFTNALLSTTAFAAVASAYIPNLQARQTTALSEECQSAIAEVMPLFSAQPTPPPVIMTASMPADPCATPDLSGSDLSQYQSWTSAVYDWATSNSAALNSALQQCTELTDMASIPTCTGSAAQPTGGSSEDSAATPTPTGSPSSNTNEPSNTADANATPTPGAASRETGMMAAAVVAAAGVLGFVL